MDIDSVLCLVFVCLMSMTLDTLLPRVIVSQRYDLLSGDGYIHGSKSHAKAWCSRLENLQGGFVKRDIQITHQDAFLAL